jgi:hypothetical protein
MWPALRRNGVCANRERPGRYSPSFIRAPPPVETTVLPLGNLSVPLDRFDMHSQGTTC